MFLTVTENSSYRIRIVAYVTFVRDTVYSVYNGKSSRTNEIYTRKHLARNTIFHLDISLRSFFCEKHLATVILPK